MKNSRISIFPLATLLILAWVLGCGSSVDTTELEVAEWVDPFIGTGGEGNTFPGALAPWGMVSVSPHNVRTTVADVIAGEPLVTSGYIYGGEKIHGFGLTHLSGVGCPELGAPVIMPTVGPLQSSIESRGASYADEIAKPSYYSVRFPDSGVTVEATATERVGLLRFHFPARAGDANILIDAARNLSWVKPEGEIQLVAGNEIEGWSQTGGFCMANNRQKVFFVARFTQSAEVSGTWTDDTFSSATTAAGKVGTFVRFTTAESEAIEVAIGVSYVSIANARANLDAESADFDTVRAATLARWNEVLGRIRVQGGTAEDRTVFYSALYHCLIHPNLLSDVNGEYPTMGHQGIGVASGYQRHSVFSLWDTYRTLHPLLTLVYPERQTEMMRSIAAMTEESGVPPQWELASSETKVMVGDPTAIVAADSYLKGIIAFDADGLYLRMRDAAAELGNTPHRPGNLSYLQLGYIPMQEASKVWGPVSTTLEYALADDSLARLAAALGHGDDYEALSGRAESWRNVFDAGSGFLRPRDLDGGWTDPFDPDATEGSRLTPRSGGPGYVEGTAWQYQFFVPHDIPGLADAHGSDELFVQRLQHVFDAGKFELWNEPDMAYPYLFTYIEGEARRTQEQVQAAREKYFTAEPDGIPGNDDAGAMSAWYVFSAMGFYPDCPGSLRYSLGTPVFDRIEIDLQPSFHTGETFVIEAPHPSPAHFYVTGAVLNGSVHPDPFLTHQQITGGGTLSLTMSDRP